MLFLEEIVLEFAVVGEATMTPAAECQERVERHAVGKRDGRGRGYALDPALRDEE
jgi:hypothetical protein